MFRNLFFKQLMKDYFEDHGVNHSIKLNQRVPGCSFTILSCIYSGNKQITSKYLIVYYDHELRITEWLQ